MPRLLNLLKSHRYVAAFHNNLHPAGFTPRLAAANSLADPAQHNGKDRVLFYSYDHKNAIENLQSKHPSPLKFDEMVCFDNELELPPELLGEFFEAPANDRVSVKVNPTVSRKTYLENVRLLKEHIQRGDIYEINYCICFEAHDAVIDPAAIYRKLNAISSAPFSALAKFDDKYIISSSPELFLRKRGDTLLTKPIKGTARRGKSPEEDESIKSELHNSLKERTENVMIVDVARNDLSRIAQRGSVRAGELYTIESYTQVHQMVSTVSCQLKQGTGIGPVIDATFPMASMTGAPKIRAMQLIDDYELYSRGPYSGCLGYLTSSGDMDLSVLIRSIFYNETEKYLSFSVGSAITHLCDPEKEYEECLLKAKAMLEVLGGRFIS